MCARGNVRIISRESGEWIDGDGVGRHRIGDIEIRVGRRVM
jgi:hypothetical protein